MRPLRAKYFMEIAEIVAKRSTCNRAMVGAVLVDRDRIVSTGYNGSPRGAPHCSDVGCTMYEGHCIATTHAEANALIQGVGGNHLYTTHFPCLECCKLIINSEVKALHYFFEYADLKMVAAVNDNPKLFLPKDYLTRSGVSVYRI